MVKQHKNPLLFVLAVENLLHFENSTKRYFKLLLWNTSYHHSLSVPQLNPSKYGIKWGTPPPKKRKEKLPAY